MTRQVETAVAYLVSSNRPKPAALSSVCTSANLNNGVQVSSTQTRLQGEILKFIRQRHYECGERLFSEREFAAKFSTTRASVREAITTLETLRVVERRKQSGIFLRDLNAETSIEALVLETNAGILPTVQQVEDASQVRRILEIEAAKKAAVICKKSDLEEISNVLRDSENRLLAGESIIREDELFHKKIVGSSQNILLLRVVNWFYEFSKLRREHYFSDLERSKISHSEHLKIFEALQRGDPAKTSELMDEHLSHTYRLWDAILRKRDC